MKIMKFMCATVFLILLITTTAKSIEEKTIKASQKLKLANSSKIPIFTANISNVTSLTLSPDNLIIYAGLSNGKVIAYDINQSTSIPLDINCNEAPVCIEVHPNGMVLGIATYKGKVEMWDIKENKRLMSLSGVSKYPSSLCFSSTGSMVMAAYAYGSHTYRNGGGELGLNPIIIWNTNNGTLIRRFDGHEGPVEYTKFSTDGNFVFSSAEDGLWEWGVHTGKIVNKFIGKPRDLKGINISQDNNLITAFGYGRIIQWNVQMPDKPVIVYDMKESCWAFKCSLDGNIAAIGTGHTAVSSFSDNPLFAIPVNAYVKVFDVRGKRKLVSLAHHDPVQTIALSSDGHTLASYTPKDGLRVWRLKFN